MDSWSEYPVVFELSPEVALAEATLFVPGNSASGGIVLDPGAFRGLDALERAFVHATGPAVSQAGAWVARRVPRMAITAVYVPTDDLGRFLQGILVKAGRDPITRSRQDPGWQR